jgi:hypothetical protein
MSRLFYLPAFSSLFSAAAKAVKSGRVKKDCLGSLGIALPKKEAVMNIQKLHMAAYGYDFDGIQDFYADEPDDLSWLDDLFGQREAV